MVRLTLLEDNSLIGLNPLNVVNIEVATDGKGKIVGTMVLMLNGVMHRMAENFDTVFSVLDKALRQLRQ